MSRPQDIVSKLWHLCNILRESGITYPEYVTELTYLLFLKMAQETGTEDELPKGYRWENLSQKTPGTQFAFYHGMLSKLGLEASNSVRAIFSEAKTALTKEKHLKILVTELDAIDWYTARQEGALGDLYEGLLEKNSTESKSGAGQYFTPRAVVETVINVVKPKKGEIIQDPACGTGGFLIAADKFIKSKNHAASRHPLKRNPNFFGLELVRDTHRLALMNCMLHSTSSSIICGDALDTPGAELPPADLIITNPPFGTKRGGGLPPRGFPIPTSNKQLAFLQHVYLGLKVGGRAAVVMPELFGSAASSVCSQLMDICRLHTILRLPTGIFYAAGVRTNVLFFERGPKKHNNTTEVWVYDLRTNTTPLGKKKPLTEEHFRDFEKQFGENSSGNSKRIDRGETGRFRRFTREQIRERGDNLDISWLKTTSELHMLTPQEPAQIFESLLANLATVTKEIEALKFQLRIR